MRRQDGYFPNQICRDGSEIIREKRPTRQELGGKILETIGFASQGRWEEWTQQLAFPRLSATPMDDGLVTDDADVAVLVEELIQMMRKRQGLCEEPGNQKNL